MENLLVICGPTATGKTSLALHLSKLFNGEVISVDSKQVYKGMDIGTGKDIPLNSKFIIQNSKLGKRGIGFYKIDGVKIWGYDLVELTEEFSVAQYLLFAREIIIDIWSRDKLPILVGGTGLYIKGVVDGIPTAGVPRNQRLRKTLEKKKNDELFELLAASDPIKAASMNVSDRKNPRRLIRAIEVAMQMNKSKTVSMIRIIDTNKVNVLFIGLMTNSNLLNQRIRERIDRRLNQGIELEIRNLLSKGVTWKHQSMQSLGYRQWKDYLSGKKGYKDTINKWFSDEKKYAKKQLVWFKKDNRIEWFDISKRNWRLVVENTIRRWHNGK